MKCLFQGENVM